MSKYSLAKDQLAALNEASRAAGIDPHEALEALIVTSIQDLISAKGGTQTKAFLQYELDSVSADGIFEVQKR